MPKLTLSLKLKYFLSSIKNRGVIYLNDILFHAYAQHIHKSENYLPHEIHAKKYISYMLTYSCIYSPYIYIYIPYLCLVFIYNELGVYVINTNYF